MEQDFRLLLPDREATRAFGHALASSIEDRAIIALVGNIGAGKTTLVKSIAEAMGVTEVVNSPTFTMLNEYHSGRLPIFHMDLYRLAEDKTPAPLDLLLAEIDEFVESDMVLLIEWADLFPVGSNDSSLIFQLDHLVVSLNTSPALNGDIEPTDVGFSPQPQAQQLSDTAKRINKDEEIRIVSINSFGKASAELAERLKTNFAGSRINPW